MNRGEIYWADLKPRSGSEQTGRRPVIVISHDGFNESLGWRSIIVIPVSTSKAQSKRGPTAVWVPKAVSGLKHDSVALCHQITTLDRAELIQKIGRLSEEYLQAVETGLKAAVDIS